MKSIIPSTLILSVLSAAVHAETVLVEVPPLYAAAKLAYPDADIEVAIEQGQNPHHIELRPSDIVKFSSADKYISLGENANKELLEAVLSSNENVEHIEFDIEGGVGDPHIWMRPSLFAEALQRLNPEVAVETLDQLAELDSDIVKFVEENHDQFEEIGIDHDIFGLLTYPEAAPSFASFSDAHDHDHGSHETTEVLADIHDHHIHCLILTSNEKVQELSELSAENDLKVVSFDSLGWDSFVRDEPDFEGFYASMMKSISDCAEEGGEMHDHDHEHDHDKEKDGDEHGHEDSHNHDNAY